MIYSHLRTLALEQIVLNVELDKAIFGAGQDLCADLVQTLLSRVIVANLHQEIGPLQEGITKDLHVLIPAN